MRLLVIRGDLQSHSGYSASARDYCSLLAEFFDRLVGVDIHYSIDRPYEEFPYPLVSEQTAQRLARDAKSSLVISLTTPNHYARYAGAVNVGLTFWETDRLPLQGAERSPWVDLANQMSALWAPCTHTKHVFEAAGVRVPICVLPWPIAAPGPQPPGLPAGEIYDLDRRPLLAPILAGLARFRETRFRWSRWLMMHGGPHAAPRLLAELRTTAQAIPCPEEHALLCVAQDVPRKGLLLFLSEWMEFKRREHAAPWRLILKSTSIDPRLPRFDFVTRFWDHVQALKRQLGVVQAGVYLWTGDLSATDFQRLLAHTHGQVAPSLGEGFCGPAALALALGKPLIAPRHTAFADYLAAAYPYSFTTRPVSVSFVRDPLRAYDPASAWHIPAPFALADALSRFAQDSPERRTTISAQASTHFASWCSPARVRELLTEQIRHLFGGLDHAAA
jgi:glycosyltransferase involved in cell wall biosynthesis